MNEGIVAIVAVKKLRSGETAGDFCETLQLYINTVYASLLIRSINCRNLARLRRLNWKISRGSAIEVRFVGFLGQGLLRRQTRRR